MNPIVTSFFLYWYVGNGLVLFYGVWPNKRLQRAVPFSAQKFRRDLYVVAFNQIVVSSIVALLIYPRGFSTTRAPPPCAAAAAQLVCFALIQEVLFYGLHRAFHSRWLWPLHAKHHEWVAPVAVMAFYCHPVEHAVVNLFPVIAGPLLFDSHGSVTGLWFWVATLATLYGHSGVVYPWPIPAPQHDAHHRKRTVHYGALGLMDWLCQTV